MIQLGLLCLGHVFQGAAARDAARAKAAEEAAAKALEAKQAEAGAGLSDAGKKTLSAVLGLIGLSLAGVIGQPLLSGGERASPPPAQEASKAPKAAKVEKPAPAPTPAPAPGTFRFYRLDRGGKSVSLTLAAACF